MPRRRPTSAERAKAAKRESKSLDFKEVFRPGTKSEWPELLKDIVAMANSGGGVIIFGVRNNGVASSEDVGEVLSLDPAVITDKVESYTGEQFADFGIHEVKRDRKTVAVLEVGPARTAPIAFNRVGTYTPEGASAQKTAFSKGTVYFRHGAKSEPGTSSDLRDFIERRLDQVREKWLGGIRQVVEAPEGALVAMVESVHAGGGPPTEIRLTDDPGAPVYGQLDPDRTHPFRQKEVIEQVNSRLPKGAPEVNTHDILSVRRAHDISETTRPDFAHGRAFGSPQYSQSFVKWLVDRYRSDKRFFAKARDRYYHLTH